MCTQHLCFMCSDLHSRQDFWECFKYKSSVLIVYTEYIRGSFDPPGIVLCGPHRCRAWVFVSVFNSRAATPPFIPGGLGRRNYHLSWRFRPITRCDSSFSGSCFRPLPIGVSRVRHRVATTSNDGPFPAIEGNAMTSDDPPCIPPPPLPSPPVCGDSCSPSVAVVPRLSMIDTGSNYMYPCRHCLRPCLPTPPSSPQGQSPSSPLPPPRNCPTCLRSVLCSACSVPTAVAPASRGVGANGGCGSGDGDGSGVERGRHHGSSECQALVRLSTLQEEQPDLAGSLLGGSTIYLR